VEQVAELVQAKEWDKATQQMKLNFPGDSLNIGRVEEVLQMVFVCEKSDCLISIIKWVGQLDVPLQPRAYEALYEQFKVNNFTDQPEVLLLRKRVSDLPAGVLENVRAQLDQDFQRIVGRIAEGVKNKYYSLQKKINKMKKLREFHLIMNEVVTAVVGKFKCSPLDQTLLLFKYSEKLPTLGHSCYLIDAMLKMYESRMYVSLTCTDHYALHLYGHAKFVREEQANWKNVSNASQKLCTKVLDKLTNYKLKIFHLYQKHVEDHDKKNIQKLHQRNLHLRSILSEFVSWYYKKDDLSRVQNLLSAARAINRFEAIERILTQLQIEMHKCQQTNTFEAFRLFHEVKYYMSLDRFQSLDPELKSSFEQLKAKAPTCLRLLLWSEGDENQLQIVNKFFDSSLSFHQDRIVCSSSSLDQELFCSAAFDPDKALTTFSFHSGTKCCKLDAAALEDTSGKQPWTGTP
jgi:hypothetical protein